MAWLLHLTEGEGGRWSCSHGRYHFDSHDDVTEALSHLGAIAATLDGPALLVIHRLSGIVEKVGEDGEKWQDPMEWLH